MADEPGADPKARAAMSNQQDNDIYILILNKNKRFITNTAR